MEDQCAALQPRTAEEEEVQESDGGEVPARAQALFHAVGPGRIGNSLDTYDFISSTIFSVELSWLSFHLFAGVMGELQCSLPRRDPPPGVRLRRQPDLRPPRLR